MKQRPLNIFYLRVLKYTLNSLFHGIIMSLYLGHIIIEVSSIAAINLWYYELWITDMIKFLVQINTVHQEMRTIFHKVEEHTSCVEWSHYKRSNETANSNY